MKTDKSTAMKRTVSIFLSLALLLALCPAAYAAAAGTVTVIGENSYELHMIKAEQGWYACADDLAEIGGLKISNNAERKTVNIYKETPFAVLYTADHNTYIEQDGRYYVPFRDATVSCGLRFFENKSGDELHYEVLRTPKELMAELSQNVFGVRQYRLEEILCSMGNLWVFAESLARAYAMLSPMNLSAVAKAATGETDKERYTQAMAEMITRDEEDVTALSALADINKLSLKADKVLDTVDNLYKNSRAFGYWLNGANSREIDFWSAYDVIEAYGSYYNARELLDEFAKVSNYLDIKHAFETLLYIQSVTEAEENIISAMQTVFFTSDNKYTQTAANTIAAARYGIGAGIEYGTDAVFHACESQIDDAFKELAFGDPSWKQKIGKFLVTTVMDMGLHTKDKANAVMYLPIFTSFQQDLARYYYSHSADCSADNMKTLRAVGIMFLRSALAEYKKFEFDSDLKSVAQLAKKSIRDEITVLLGYGEREYAPDYTNREILAKLEQYLSTDMPPADSEPEGPYPEELFDETSWHMCFGTTIAQNPDAVFHLDGTFTLSYPEEEGTYTYADGKLTISYSWVWYADFVWNGSEFISTEKYELGIGGDYSDYYTITPITPTEDPVSPEKESVSRLPDGKYYGELKSWTADTMTVECLDYAGRQTESFNYVLVSTGEVYTLDISQADIVLEEPWSEDYNEVYCSSIDEALDTRIWGGSTTVRNNYSKSICFGIKDGQVMEVVILYAA